MLSPLIKAKNDAHLRMIQCNTSANRKEYRRHQRKVMVAVNNTEEEWICRVAKEGEAAKKGWLHKVEEYQEVAVGS